MNRKLRKIVLEQTAMAALLLLSLSGCSSPTPPIPTDRSLMWPPAPAQPRIAYEQSITGPADLGINRSWWRVAGSYLIGSNRGDLSFTKPTGLCFDEAGNLCVTDTSTGTVWYFDTAHKRYKRWSRIGDLVFSSPVAVAKRDGIIYVADTGLGGIIAFNESGKLLFTIMDGLERPSGLVFDGQMLWVADAARHRIAAFDLKGNPIANFGQRGTDPGEFNYPTHLALAQNADHALYVTDSMNFRIQKVDAKGHPLQTIGAIGNVTGSFSRPKGLALGRDGILYVVDALFDNIQMFDPEGRFLMHWGESGNGAGQFWLPSSIAIDAQNRIWVADSYNQRIQIFKPVGDL